MAKNSNAKRITKRTVDAHKCAPGRDRSILWDDALAGFGVVAHASGAKAYIVQYRQNGRSHRFTLGPHGRLTPDTARARAHEILGAVQTGKDPIGERAASRKAELAARAFREVAEDFMRLHVAQKRKNRTFTEYRGLLDRDILPSLGATRIAELRRADVVRLHASFAKRPFQANRCLALISAIWNWAAKREEVAFGDNPAKGIERYEERARARYLTTDELARMGDALREAETIGIPWQALHIGLTTKHTPKGSQRTKLDAYAIAAIRLLILTGARLREILHAKWTYVDLDRSMLLLPDSKTGRKTIYLSAPALAVLAKLTRVDGNPYIFPGDKKAKPRTDLKRPWDAIARVAKLQGVRIHDLRHSFASVGAGASLGLPILGKLLGHSHAATTARYSHLDADPMQKAANIIGARIADALGRNGNSAGQVVNIGSPRSRVRRRSTGRPQ